MQFDGIHYSEMMGSLLVDDAVKDIPLFGAEKKPITTIASQILQSPPPETDPILDLEAKDTLPQSFFNAITTAGKLNALRKYAETINQTQVLSGSNKHINATSERREKALTGPLVRGTRLTSNRQMHENLLKTTLDTRGFPKSAQVVLDHIMLLRSKERYLFDYPANIDIASDDPWVKDLWLWVASMHPLSPVAYMQRLTYLSRSLKRCLR
jgi:hypothetical protein